MTSQLRRPGSAGRFVGLGWILWDHMMFVPAYPSENSKSAATSDFGQVGGPVARALVLLSGFGADTRLTGAVGDDPFGREALAELVRRGVDVADVEVAAGAASRVGVVSQLGRGYDQWLVGQ